MHFVYPTNTNSEIKSKAISEHFISKWREECLKSPYFDLKDWHQIIDLGNKQSIINVAESQDIIKKLSLKSYEAGYKIMLIWKAELFNQQAANKLLKTIEEPTNKTLLILIVEEEEKLLRTILSRTQIIKIPPIMHSDLSYFLIENGLSNSEKVEQYSRISNGNYILCKQLIANDDERDFFLQLFKQWMRACYEADIKKIIDWVNKITKDAGREEQKRFLSFVLHFLHEVVLKNYLTDQSSHFHIQEDNFLNNFSPFIHENNLVPITNLLNDASNNIERNAYAKIVFMDVSLRLANLLKAKKRTFVG